MSWRINSHIAEYNLGAADEMTLNRSEFLNQIDSKLFYLNEIKDQIEITMSNFQTGTLYPLTLSIGNTLSELIEFMKHGFNVTCRNISILRSLLIIDDLNLDLDMYSLGFYDGIVIPFSEDESLAEAENSNIDEIARIFPSLLKYKRKTEAEHVPLGLTQNVVLKSAPQVEQNKTSGQSKSHISHSNVNELVQSSDINISVKDSDNASSKGIGLGLESVEEKFATDEHHETAEYNVQIAKNTRPFHESSSKKLTAFKEVTSKSKLEAGITPERDHDGDAAMAEDEIESTPRSSNIGIPLIPIKHSEKDVKDEKVVSPSPSNQPTNQTSLRQQQISPLSKGIPKLTRRVEDREINKEEEEEEKEKNLTPGREKYRTKDTFKFKIAPDYEFELRSHDRFHSTLKKYTKQQEESKDKEIKFRYLNKILDAKDTPQTIGALNIGSPVNIIEAIEVEADRVAFAIRLGEENPCYFKAKAKSKLKKALKLFAIKNGLSISDLTFTYEGRKILPENTPLDLELENGSTVQCTRIEG